jgi:hypothetical protein
VVAVTDAKKIILNAITGTLSDLSFDTCESVNEHVLAAIHEAGFKIVAREPSRLMLDIAEQGDDLRTYDEIWGVMWDAA